jgi:hypothetical protein
MARALKRLGCDLAQANLGASQIDQNSQRTPSGLFGCPNGLYGLPMFGWCTVSHVQAKDVNARSDQLLELRCFTAGRTNCGNDLCSCSIPNRLNG